MSNPLVSLKAMAEAKADGIQKATYFKVDPYAIEFEEGFNIRDEGPELTDHIEGLYLAMKAGAYVPPIDVSVVDGRIKARDGHCRTRAARRIVDEGTPYQLEARQIRGNEADSTFHMLGSDQGLKFSPLARAKGYQRLISYGETVASIAARLGVHRATVENALALCDAPVAVQAMVKAGEVSPSLALQTVRKHGTKAADKLQAAVKTAKESGKKKATARNVEPKPRGQTLPPQSDTDALIYFVRQIADMKPTHDPVQQLGMFVTEANRLLGR